MNRTAQYLKECKTFYLATMDNDQPRVRPFGAAAIYNDKLYFCTGNKKPVYQQMIANPKAEICGCTDNDTKWIRLTGTLVEDTSMEAKVAFLEQEPSLKRMYAADDGVFSVFYIENATATFYSFTAPPETTTF